MLELFRLVLLILSSTVFIFGFILLLDIKIRQWKRKPKVTIDLPSLKS